MTRFVVVASGKGGVGKTTTALNLALALIGFGRNVMVIDGNISTPNIGLHLGAPTIPITLQHVLQGKNKIKDAVYLHPTGLKLIPSSISLGDSDDVLIKKLKEVLPDLKDIAEIVLIDAAAGLGSEALNSIKYAEDLIVVTNPDIPAVTDALKTIRKAEIEGTKVLGIVVNQVRGDSHELSIKNIETILEKPIIGIIPYDDSVRKSLHLKNPVMHTYPMSNASKAYKKLAANLIGEKYIDSVIDKKGMFDYIMTRLGFSK